MVGAGPTGVEMAGQIAELAKDTLRGDFREIDTRSARILLVEAGPRVLAGFAPSLSEKAARLLEELGVTPLVDRPVVGIDEHGVDVESPDGDERADRRPHGHLGGRRHGVVARLPARRESRTPKSTASAGSPSSRT